MFSCEDQTGWHSKVHLGSFHITSSLITAHHAVYVCLVRTVSWYQNRKRGKKRLEDWHRQRVQALPGTCCPSETRRNERERERKVRRGREGELGKWMKEEKKEVKAQRPMLVCVCVCMHDVHVRRRFWHQFFGLE